MTDKEQAPRMSKDQTLHALDFAFAQHVNELFRNRVAAGETDVDAKARFEDGIRQAQRVHDEAVASFSKPPEEILALEDDDAFRARMLPIAGDEAWRGRIKAAEGPDLDKLGDHYNLKREVRAPVDPEQAEADEKAEADREELAKEKTTAETVA